MWFLDTDYLEKIEKMQKRINSAFSCSCVMFSKREYCGLLQFEQQIKRD